MNLKISVWTESQDKRSMQTLANSVVRKRKEISGTV
jgi:hypothetical protein